MLKKAAAGLALGVLAAAIVAALAATGALDVAELKAYDWRMRLAADPASVNRNIVLVEINDASIRELAPTFGHWPWPRLALSFVIDFLKRGPAKVIAVDLNLAEPDTVALYKLDEDRWSGQQSDRALTDSVRADGRVIMLADAVYEGQQGQSGDRLAAAWRDPGYRVDAIAEPRPVILPPYQALADATMALGHNFLVRDVDGPARRMAPFVSNGGRDLPSLGVAAALAAGGFSPAVVSADGASLRIGDRHVPLVSQVVAGHRQWTMLIDYRAPAFVRGPQGLECPYPAFEFRHLFASEQQLLTGQKPFIDPAVFKDKIVFIGFTASGLVDVFGTPLSNQANGSMPGIQLHASMADSILANRFIRPASSRLRLATIGATAIAIGLFAAFLPFTASAAASVAALAVLTWASIALFKSGLWLNLVQPAAAGGLALFFGTAYQYFVEGREKRKVSKLFGRYVSPDVYAQLMSHPEQAQLGGKRREMTVLFSDIRGFTTVTERGDPEALVGQLNDYFSRMVEIVFRHQGTVDKFVGDMVMALFGAPLDDPDHAEHAMRAAIDMVRELGELNRGWVAAGSPQLDIGIGINSGEMIAGNIGSSSIMSYTVIGDNVNLASRLESLNKDYKTRIIISDATRLRLTGSYETRPLGDGRRQGQEPGGGDFRSQVAAPLVHEVQTT